MMLIFFMAVSRLSCKGVRRYRHNSKAMTISGDPAHGGSYTLASAGPDEPTVNAGFDVSRTFVGFVHDIAPSAQRFGDAGKPCFFGGRKTVYMVTDFVEHIDDVVDAFERVGDFCRPRHCQAPHLRKSAPANLAAQRRPFAQNPAAMAL
jgi:hypothetical protein